MKIYFCSGKYGRIRISIGVLIFGTLATGCVTNTVSELRNDSSSYDGSVQVQYTPDRVFRSLKEAAKNCLEQAPMGTPVVSESEFDISAETGQIRQRMTAQQVLLNMTIIEIYRGSEAGTTIKLYTIKGWKSIGVTMPKKDDLVRWIEGDKVCWANR
ncbi:hypothetical protein [Janthinobacterium tructae]|uniref:hypothetical protein n=1 Tax=Janthinobacterium tructae TaxID=2590869 RepID=UPI00249B0C2D|nr:hypothetical protein [Janthinobacterium tructae]MDI3292518.1 hypothetical protein [Janthinobacterium tructae]